MEKQIYVVSIDEEFEKARVKGFIRTRKGKLERVTEFERKGKEGVKVFISNMKSKYEPSDVRQYTDKAGTRKLWFEFFGENPAGKVLNKLKSNLEKDARKAFGKNVVKVTSKEIDPDARTPSSVSIFLKDPSKKK